MRVCEACRLILIVLCLPLMILGCSGAKDQPQIAPVSPVVDTTAIRCPDLDQKTRRDLDRATPDPEPGPKQVITAGQTQKWIDDLKTDRRVIAAAGKQIAREYDACRSGTAKDRRQAPAKLS